MLTKTDSIILNYINKYGIVEKDTYKINQILQEQHLVSLINSLFDKLEVKNKVITSYIKQLDVVYEPKKPALPIPAKPKDLKQIKDLIMQMLEIINDTEKIHARLFNLELGLVFLTEFDKTNPNYDTYVQLYKTEVDKDNYLLDFFNQVVKTPIDNSKYKPLQYEEFKIDLDGLSLEQLLEISDLLVEKEKTLKQGLEKLIGLSNTITNVNISASAIAPVPSRAPYRAPSRAPSRMPSRAEQEFNNIVSDVVAQVKGTTSQIKQIASKVITNPRDNQQIPIYDEDDEDIDEEYRLILNKPRSEIPTGRGVPNNFNPLEGLPLFSMSKMKKSLQLPDNYNPLAGRSLFSLPGSKPVPDNFNPIAGRPLFRSSMRGGVSVYETINKLSLLNSKVDKLTSLSIEQDIPSGINLEIDSIKQIINNLKLKLETQAHENDKPIDNDKKFKKLEFNLFEDVPEYTKMNFGPQFITNPLNPSIPRDDISIKDIDDILQIIKLKNVYFDEKIKSINLVLADINTFEEKIKLYRNKELDNAKSLKFKFSNLGEKKDISDYKNELEENIKETETKIGSDKASLPLLETKEFTDYLVLKNNYKPVADFEQDLLEVKTLIASGLNPGSPVIVDNNISEDVKKALNAVFLVRGIKYQDGYFLDDNNYKNFEELLRIFEEFKNLKGNLQQSQVAKEIKSSGLDTAFFMRVFRKFQKNTIGDDSKDYKPIAEKLNQLVPKYKKDKEDIIAIQTVETANPVFLEKYNSIKDTFDFNNITQSIQTMIDAIKASIKEKEEQLVKNKKDFESTASLLTDYKEVDYKSLITINDREFDAKVELLHNKIKEINEKLKLVFNLKDGTEPTSLLETTIPTSGKTINSKWFHKSAAISGGGFFADNLKNLLKINDLNNAMKGLISKLEKYKSYASDLLEKYTMLIKQLQEIVVYVYYRLIALKEINTGKSPITKQFTQESLNKLLNDIKNINRKNFGLLKDIYIQIIENILLQQKNKEIEKSEYKYIVFDNATTSLLDLFVLVHINNNITLI